MRLIVRPDAEADVAAAFDCTKNLPAVFRKLRRALVQRFPYGVFFVVRPEEIVIVAAMHLARDPRRVHRRTKSDF